MNKKQILDVLKDGRLNRKGYVISFSSFVRESRAQFFYPVFPDSSMLSHEEIDVYISLLEEAKTKATDLEVEEINNNRQEERINELNSHQKRNNPALKKKKGFVYLMRSENDKYKIGYSKDPKKRLKSLQNDTPFALECLRVIQTDDMTKLERDMHKHYKDRRIVGEWFSLNDEDVSYFMKYEAEENEL